MHDIGLKVVILMYFYTQEEIWETVEQLGGEDDAVDKFFKEVEQDIRDEVEAKAGKI